MKAFIDDDFLLNNKTSQRLYHDYAEGMPIIDYHCHLPPQQIAADAQFANITQGWLYGDHYKWRAMRTNGVDECFITGDKPDDEKFMRWSATVPYTVRNPLYHWTHLELRRYFSIETILNEKTGRDIYYESSNKLTTPDYSVCNLLRKMNVRLVCTTDDPLDNLAFHQQLKLDGCDIVVLPAFRPDAAMNVTNPATFNGYVGRLEGVADVSISNYDTFLQALKKRHDYFAENGCGVSDHGLEEIYADDYTEKEVTQIFDKIRTGQALDGVETNKFRSAMLNTLAEWDCEKGWVQQFHLGAIRNNNSRMMAQLGPDTGWDSIGDFRHARPLAKFLGNLNKNNRLAKTILYNLNPADNEVFATMIGNFNEGGVPGKIQWGSAWWFLDQKDGMTKQLNALSNMGMLSRFVGMLTDSRSFLSFPRHEYFRRLLCNIFGEEIENGELPNDIPWIGKIVQDICFNNAKTYFNWDAVLQASQPVETLN